MANVKNQNIEQLVGQVILLEEKLNLFREEGKEYFSHAHKLVSDLRYELENNYQIVKNHLV